MFKKAESMDDIKKILSNMKLEDKVNLLADIDVDWDGFFASVIFQKMQNDPNMSEKIKSKLSGNTNNKTNDNLDIDKNIGVSDEKDENTSIEGEKEKAKEEVKDMFSDIEDLKDNEENQDSEEDKEKEVKPKNKEKIIKFKLKKDEFEGNKLNDKKSYNSTLNHDSDEYSVNRDYSVNDGNTSYDPASTEDYIIDEEDNELNPGNPKGKKNWRIDDKKN